MKLDDQDRYHSTEVNRDLYNVYFGVELVGQVRRGMDGLWYPQLPAERFKAKALHRVVLANEAINEFVGVTRG